MPLVVLVSGSDWPTCFQQGATKMSVGVKSLVAHPVNTTQASQGKQAIYNLGHPSAPEDMPW